VPPQVLLRAALLTKRLLLESYALQRDRRLFRS
jgi:hypothetical protein